MKRSVITGTGSYIPTELRKNMDFSDQEFYGEDGLLIAGTQTLLTKFRTITRIEKSRYVPPYQKTSDFASIAGARAIEDSRIDRELLDLIIVAHVFVDLTSVSAQTD